jgi:hypothetical protein
LETVGALQGDYGGTVGKLWGTNRKLEGEYMETKAQLQGNYRKGNSQGNYGKLHASLGELEGVYENL